MDTRLPEAGGATGKEDGGEFFFFKKTIYIGDPGDPGESALGSFLCVVSKKEAETLCGG